MCARYMCVSFMHGGMCVGQVWPSEDTSGLGLAVHLTEAAHLLFLLHRTRGCLVRESPGILFLVLLNDFQGSKLMASGLEQTPSPAELLPRPKLGIF